MGSVTVFGNRLSMTNLWTGWPLDFLADRWLCFAVDRSRQIEKIRLFFLFFVLFIFFFFRRVTPIDSDKMKKNKNFGLSRHIPKHSGRARRMNRVKDGVKTNNTQNVIHSGLSSSVEFKWHMTRRWKRPDKRAHDIYNQMRIFSHLVNPTLSVLFFFDFYFPYLNM